MELRQLLNIKETNTLKQIKKKMYRRPKQTFLQKGHTDGQQTLERMLNIANYQRNEKQNYNEVPPDISQNDHHQKKFTNNLKRCMNPMFIAVLFTKAKTEATQMFTDR